MTIPLMSEFLRYTEGDQETSKQDCERKAFERLARRLNDRFPRLRIQVFLDGLYPNGPVMETCHRYGWQYMIVLQDGNLPTVWEEVEGLGKLQTRNHLDRIWGNRKQQFRWVNDIEYRYGDKERKKQVVHVVICQESWEEVDLVSARIVPKRSKHAWLSSQPLNRENVHERCNFAAEFSVRGLALDRGRGFPGGPRAVAHQRDGVESARDHRRVALPAAAGRQSRR